MNSSFCDNGYCMTAAAVCPDACATFRHGAWTGYAGGGPGSNASNPGRSDAGVVDPVDPVDPVDAGGLSEWPECGGLVDDSDGCGECLIDSCCWELETCAADVDCTGLFECIQSCTSDACIQGCADTYSWGVSDLRSIADCMNSYCEFACG